MELISIDSIKTKSSYLRVETNIEKLKKSIETVGLISPLVINNDNELIAGGRRYSALKELGVQEVPVFRVDKSESEQELISIDENLVRKDLTKIEFEKCLNRGREIYEDLYPNAKKVVDEDMKTEEGINTHENLPNEERSFIDLTSEKTGLSKKVIKSAIDRDANSSEKVKEYRQHGELNASQTNEIIKLDKDQQDKVVDLVKDKSTKEVRQLVESIKVNGVDKAVDEVLFSPGLPKEYKSIDTLTKRLNKLAAKVLLEDMTSDHKDMKKIIKGLTTLRNHLDQVLVLASGEKSVSSSETSFEPEYDPSTSTSSEPEYADENASF
jgi:ParB family chromosome partitioning protein